MAITVAYDNQSPWGNNVPYVSMEKQAIMQLGKIAQVTLVTLSGQLDSITLNQANPGVQDDTLLEPAKNAILNLFRNSFRTFEFFDDTIPRNTPFFCGSAIVESVDFPEQKLIGVADWTATLKCYENNYFDDLGIVEKADSFSMQKDPTDTVRITHRIYAKAVNIWDSFGDPCEDPLTAATAFVNSRRGLGNIGNTFIVLNALGPGTPILMDESESINRLEGTYEVIETWTAFSNDEDLVNAPGLYAIRHSVDMSEASFDKDFQEANVTYTITGGRDSTLAELRDAANLVTHSSIENGAHTGVGNRMHDAAVAEGLTHHPDSSSPFNWKSDDPLTLAIEEDMANKTITKKALFTNDPRWVRSGVKDLPVYFDFEVSIDTDEIKSVTSVSIDATIGSIGTQISQQNAIEDFLTEGHPDSIVPNENDGQISLGRGNTTTTAGGRSSVQCLMAEIGHHHYHLYKNFDGPLQAPFPRGSWTLNINQPKNQQYSFDREKSQGSVSITFNDEDFLNYYEDVSYNISVDKPIIYRKSSPSANIDGHYSLAAFEASDDMGNVRLAPDGVTPIPMYTRQKHTIRVALSHGNPFVPCAGTIFAPDGNEFVDASRHMASQLKAEDQAVMLGLPSGQEISTRQKGKDLLNTLEAMYTAGLPAEASLYVLSENETHGSELTESISASRSSSYETNTPLITVPPDPQPDPNNGFGIGSP